MFHWVCKSQAGINIASKQHYLNQIDCRRMPRPRSLQSNPRCTNRWLDFWFWWSRSEMSGIQLYRYLQSPLKSLMRRKAQIGKNGGGEEVILLHWLSRPLAAFLSIWRIRDISFIGFPDLGFPAHSCVQMRPPRPTGLDLVNFWWSWWYNWAIEPYRLKWWV